MKEFNPGLEYAIAMDRYSRDCSRTSFAVSGDLYIGTETGYDIYSAAYLRECAMGIIIMELVK